MQKLSYSTQIKISADEVWKALTELELYKVWTKAFSADSQFEGEFKQGESIRFIDPGRGGTLAIVETVKEPEHLFMRHTAVINVEGREDTESEEAKNWIGTTESYLLKIEGEATNLTVEIETHKNYVSMFEKSWPEALGLLKSLCEG